MPGDAITIGAAVVLLVGIPVLTARGGLSDEQLDDVRDARSSVYVSASLSLIFLAGLFFLIALWRDLPPEVVTERGVDDTLRVHDLDRDRLVAVGPPAVDGVDDDVPAVE